MSDNKIIGSIILEGASTSEDTVITGSGSRRVIKKLIWKEKLTVLVQKSY